MLLFDCTEGILRTNEKLHIAAHFFYKQTPMMYFTNILYISCYISKIIQRQNTYVSDTPNARDANMNKNSPYL